MKKLAVLLTVLVATALVGVPLVGASDVCTGVLFGKVEGNLTVPSGETCSLQNVVLNGSIGVELNARFQSVGSLITGSVSSNGAAAILIADTYVGVGIGGRGDQLVSVIGSSTGYIGWTRDPGSVTITDTHVRGNLTIERSGAASARGNMIAGNLTIEGNGEANVFGNMIGGNADCRDNTALGSGNNIVGGMNQC